MSSKTKPNTQKNKEGLPKMTKIIPHSFAFICVLLLSITTAQARQCGNTSAGFGKWLQAFKAEMHQKGISKRTLNAAFKGVRYSTRVIRLDRGQKSFKQSFEKFYKRRTAGMVPIARKKFKKHRTLFDRIEKKYGVPREMLVTVWGLETAFGRFMGKLPIITSLATLSYDCRRSDFFTAELIAALKIIENGDLTPAQMRGAWAGEIGQTQFLATRYVDYAVSFDGNKTRDLYRSVPDALASTAAWFKGNGWQAGQGWDEGSANYEVIKEWNRATVYQKTIAKLANKLSKYR